MADRSLRFDLIGRDRSLGRTLKKGERDTERFRQRISGVGIAAGGAALAGLGILGAGALKLAGDFDDAYDTIRVGTGKTGKSLAGLKKDFRAVVRDIPADFGDASTAVAELNRRTGQSGKPLQALAKRTLELTRLTGGDLSTNIASVTRLFGDWGIKTGDQSKTLDKLFRASQATGVGVDTLAQSVVKFGAPLRQLGFSFDESITLLAKFEKEGVNSSLVMSGMKIALGKLAKAGKDPQKGFLDLTQRIKDAGSSAAANKIAIEAFGQRAGPDMAAAIREGRLSIRDLQKQISDGKDTILGAAKDAEDFGEKWKRVTNKIKLLAEPVVTKGLDILSTKTGDLEKFLTKNLIPKLGGLRDKWNQNKDAILGLLDPFGQVNDKSKTADQRAQQLADSLTAATEGIGKVARGLKTLGDGINAVSRSFSVAGEAIHVNFVRPMMQSLLGLTRFALGQWRALMGGAATLVEALPGGRNSGLGKALRAAERQIGALEAGAQREFNGIASLSEGVTAKVPGGNRSGFNRSLVRAGKQASDFRGEWNRQIGSLAGKSVTVTGHAKIDWSAFNESEKRHRAQYPFQSGGIAPGTGTGDKVHALVEPGEVIWPNREPDRKRLLKDPRVRARLGFQHGGVVVGTRGLDATSDKLQEFARQVAPRLGPSVAGSLGGNLRRVLAGYAERFVGSALKKYLAGGAGIKAFIRSTDPLPYVWGGAGPGGYDCSGLVSAVYGKHTKRGGGHGQRYFTTASIGTHVAGLKPGLGGVLQIGVTPSRGHMAGSYAGLGFEAESTRTGIKTGSAASSPASFSRHFHMAKGGLVYQRMVEEFARLTGADVGGDAGHIRINGQVADRGATLTPGLNLLANRTGRPEPLVPAGGVDEDRLAKKIARELAAVWQANPPTVRFEDVRTAGLAYKRGRGGLPIGLG
jgi:TP901 family phage tail tape measure protein